MEQTVTKQWEMRCPKCGSDENIRIAVEVWADLTPEGTITENAEHEWDHESRAYCFACDFSGTVLAFHIKPNESAKD